jgi:hypothetical protein
LSLPAGERDTPLDLASESPQLVSRHLVGLLLVGSDQLAQGQGGGFVSVASFFGLTDLAALTFALIYKVLPNAKVAWRHVWVGAGVIAP